MKTDTSAKIIRLVEEKRQVTAHDLVGHLKISPQAVFRQLKRLVTGGLLYKIGKPPKVFYLLSELKKEKVEWNMSVDAEKSIQRNFLIFTATGEKKEGMDGFEYWCLKTAQPIEKTAIEYQKTLKKYDVFKKKGLIDGIGKLRSSFAVIWLDCLFYLDFYSIERFGKTKLGQLLLYAKQSQNIQLIRELITDIQPKVRQLIKDHRIDGVGFIPPTVKREVQFMKELERNLSLNVPVISIVKITTDVAIPQKTLNKIEDRIENAQKTIIAIEKNTYRNILLIDDAVGSGATLNETARQLKENGICTGKIIGLAITGSFKGFDVISEV